MYTVERSRRFREGTCIELVFEDAFLPFMLSISLCHKNRFSYIFFSFAIYSKTVKEKYFVLHFLSKAERGERGISIFSLPGTTSSSENLLIFQGETRGLAHFGINFNLHAWLLEIPVLRNRNN